MARATRNPVRGHTRTLPTFDEQMKLIRELLARGDDADYAVACDVAEEAGINLTLLTEIGEGIAWRIWLNAYDNWCAAERRRHRRYVVDLPDALDLTQPPASKLASHWLVDAITKANAASPDQLFVQLLEGNVAAGARLRKQIKRLDGDAPWPADAEVSRMTDTASQTALKDIRNGNSADHNVVSYAFRFGEALACCALAGTVSGFTDAATFFDRQAKFRVVVPMLLAAYDGESDEFTWEPRDGQQWIEGE